VLTYAIKAQLLVTNSANPGAGTTAVPAPVPHPPPVTKKFTALCVNAGEFNKTLGEIEISSISTDDIAKCFKNSRRSIKYSVDPEPVRSDGFL
jgi:hypothetical protein